MRSRCWGILVAAAGLIAALAPQAQAEVKLPSIFGSSMVLQRGMPVPV